MCLSFVSAYTLEQQNEVCSVLNLSFAECYQLWDYVANYPNSSFCSNNTVYVNQTNNVTVYVAQNCSEQLDFIKQSDATRIRLAEIEKGVSSSPSNCSLPSDVISVSDCEIEKQDQFLKGRTAVCPTTSSTSSSSSFSNFDFKKYWWLVLIALALLYFGYQKFSSRLTLSQPFVSNQNPSYPSYYPPQNPVYKPLPNDTNQSQEGQDGSWTG